LDYIRATPTVWEVILSGGDPLLLSPRRLRDIALALEGTEHVAVLRLHSRVPVAAPERITEQLAEALRLDRLAVYLVVHCNHAREITPEMRSACRRLA